MRQRLDVVVPACNEADGIDQFHRRLADVLDSLALDCRVIYVDDGSRDATWTRVEALAHADARVVGVKLSRNFGKELAMTAGLDASDADAVIIIDADLQDPPELIGELLGRWRDGYDMVYATRLEREGETWLKRTTAAGFYRLMDWLSQTPIPRDTGDFRLLSRRAVDAVCQLRERHRFMKGLFSWVGFRHCSVPYHRDPRHSGRSKFNYWRLWNFAIEGITSFSTAPLRIATYVGVLTALFAFGLGAWVALKTLLWGDPVAGYPSLMVTVLFIGGVQLTALGVIGEYLGRLYNETKQRPLYLVEQRLATAPQVPTPLSGLQCPPDRLSSK